MVIFLLLIISKVASVPITASKYNVNLNRNKIYAKTDSKNHGDKFPQHSLLYSLETAANINKK